MDASDKKNLGKAIGGFANSRGGVIVWGIDCRESTPPEERNLDPGLNDPDAFVTVATGLISRATIPAVAGIRMEVIRLSSSRSAVVMLVPHREYGPVRTMIGESDKYFFRAGESFLPVPHDVLASMFGKVPPPVLEWKPLVPDDVAWSGGCLTLKAVLTLYNAGNGMAFHPFLTVRPFLPGEKSTCRVTRKDNQRFFRHEILNQFVTFVGLPDHPLPAGGLAAVGELMLELRPPFIRNLSLQFDAGAKDAFPTTSGRRVDPDRLRGVAEAARIEKLSMEQVWSLLFAQEG